MQPEPLRVYMPSIPGWVEPLIYLAFGIVLLVVAHDAIGRLRRYGGWREFLVGLARAIASRPGTVLSVLLSDVLGQRRIRRDRLGGLVHGLIFGAFVVLVAGTFLIVVEEDFTSIAGLRFLHGSFYLAYEAALDSAGLLFIAGLLLALWRRYSRRAPYMDMGGRRSMPLLYVILFFAPLSGFLLEALRILVHPTPWSGYSYVGSALAGALMPLVGEHPLEFYWAVWATHVIGVFAAMAIVLRTALEHVLLLPMNMALQADRDPSRLSLPFNLSTLADEADLEALNPGFGRVDDLDWKRRFSLDVCIGCGRCETACPAFAAGRPLSPRALVQALGAEIRALPGNGHETSSVDLFGRGVLEEAAVWSCLTCGACANECPARIDQPGTIVDLRRHLVAEGRLDDRQAALLTGVERNGNPFALPSHQRGEWLAELGVPTIAECPDADYLYWIGCMAAYDPRVRRVAVAMIRILRYAGVRFAVLGDEERCTGESMRKMGEEAGFQLRAMETIALLQEYGVHRILTHCPHCLSTFAKGYPALGGNFEVVHHSELLAELICAGRVPQPKVPIGGPVTYHDPCNLGRLGGQYDTPRKVGSFAAGAPLVEMERARDRAFCCGGGGGNYWWRVPQRQPVSHVRLEQVRATGAAVVATACPFCLAMLEDASGQVDDAPRIADLAELVATALPDPDGT